MAAVLASMPMSGAAKKRPVILVVEDDADLLQMLGRLLSEFADVELTADGGEALRKVQEGLRPDLVLSDVMMPTMDGLTLAKRLKNERGTTNVPVILLTAKNTPKDVIAGIQSGARAYITKPFKQDELIGKVKKALRL